MGFGKGKNLIAVFSEQGFIGGDHMFAVFNGMHNHVFSQRRTTNHFDNNIDIVTGSGRHQVTVLNNVRVDIIALTTGTDFGNHNIASATAF